MPVSKITTMVDPPSRVEQFAPDGRWYHPLVAMATLYALVGIPHWTHLTPWILGPVGLVGSVAAVKAVREHFHAAHYGEDLPQAISTVVAIGGTLATVWLVWGGFQPHQSPWLTSPAGVGGLAVLTLAVGVFYAALVTRAPGLEAANHERIAAGHDAYRSERDQQAADEWEAILHSVPGCEGLKVLERVTTEGGTTLHLLDDPEKPLKLNGLNERCGVIESIAAHKLAVRGIKLLAGKVTAEAGEAAHLLKLHINTNDRFRHQNIPFDMTAPVESITSKKVLAVYEDGQDVALDLYGKNAIVVAATGGGKDVFTNNVIAQTTCPDGEVWVGGSDKLSPLVWPWLLPWFKGETDRPVLGRVAGEEPMEVLKMLADLLHAVKLQNKQLGPGGSSRLPSPQDPAITCIITEASDLLIDHHRVAIKCFDGVVRNGSQLVNAIARSDRSAGCGLWLQSQYGLMDALGAYGTYAKRNITIRVCGKTYSYSDGQQTLVGLTNVNTTRLENHTVLIQPSTETPRAMAAKAAHLDTVDQIGPVARRNTQHVPTGLPDWIASQLAHYEGRWDRDRLPDLAALVDHEGYTWPSHSLPRSVTVRGTEGDTTPPETEETRAMTATRLMQEGREKMAAAREKIALYGPLGETMSLVMDAALAGDSPEFLPLSPLAIVTGLSPRGEDTSPVEERLVRELSGKPWGLSPVIHDGQRGWWKQDIIDRCREFLTGETAPRRDMSPDTVPLLEALSRSRLPLDGEAVKSSDVLSVAAGELGWPDNPEGARKVADALRTVGVESFRPTGGDRSTSYPCGPLTVAIGRYVGIAAS